MLARTLALPALLVALAPQALAQSPSTPSARDPFRARAVRVLRATPLVDGHNDLPWRIREDTVARGDVARYDLRHHTPGHTDFDRMRRGMLGAQFWSVYIPGEADDPVYSDSGSSASQPGYARVQLEQIELARRMIAAYPERMEFVTTAAGVRRAFAAHRVGSLLGVEGGHAIENSLDVLRAYYDLGVRYMTLTHNVTLDWADAALDSAVHGGLTPFGREVVREMNRLGILVDLAHVSPGTMSAALDVTEAPVIFSHSCARALVDYPRNVPDSILARLPRNGGVVMVAFVSSFVSPQALAYDSVERQVVETIRRQHPHDPAGQRAAHDEWRATHPAPPATIAQVADHIDHVRKVAGVNHVGIGSDFDGFTVVPKGLEDVSGFPNLFAELARRGWTDAELRKLAGENVLRVMARAEAVARRLRRTRSPSTATIRDLDHPVRHP